MITIDENKYKTLALSNIAAPPSIYAPFINVDYTLYNDLKSKSSSFDIKPLRSRMGKTQFAKLRGALGTTLKYAQSFFPAFVFFVNEFLNEEWLATVDWHSFHRDHTVHQSMVAHIGLWLLNGCEESGKKEMKFGGKTLLEHCVDTILHKGGRCEYLVEYLKEMGDCDIYVKDNPADKGYVKTRQMLWEWLVQDTFFLAALFHDLGYPWRFVNTLHEKLEPHSPENNPAEQSAEWIINRYNSRLVFYPLNGYKKLTSAAPANWRDRLKNIVRESLTKTHGMPGAISFLHLNDILRKFPVGGAPPVRQFCIEWAAMAVMMHNMAKIYAKIENGKSSPALKVKNPHLRLQFNKDPLSCILTLCDIIQDFCRPNARFYDLGKDNIKLSYASSCNGIELLWDDSAKKLKITYLYNNHSAAGVKRTEFIPKDQLLYFDSKQGYLDFSSIGIQQIELDARKK